MTADDADVVIVGAARTPQGRLRGRLGTVPATRLGGVAIRGALARAGVAPSAVDAVVMGQALQAGAGQNPARQAAHDAGIGWGAPAITLNAVCLSGLSAVIEAARRLRLGEARVVAAGGMESMTQAPHLLPGSRSGHPYGTVELLDHVVHDGLTDAYDRLAMGELTEDRTPPVAREVQDAVAAASQQKAARARKDGVLAAEIVPVTVPRRGGDDEVADDEGIRPDTTVEVLARLRPAFRPGGSITAGNASALSDGAAATVLTTRGQARSNGWPVLATLRAHAEVAGPDTTLHHQPARALTAALDKQGWTTADLMTLEVNEAFAAVAASSAAALGLSPHDPRLNPEGGAIALGHPLGASGARLVVHVAHRIARSGGKGAVALCGGGGQGATLLLEG